MSLNIVILAAGQGKRMYSSLPKVLHPLGGKPLLQHVIDTARTLSPDHLVVVYGHGGETVREAMGEAGLAWALQSPQLGTGHAVAQALPLLNPEWPTLVLYGDVPLVQQATLEALIAKRGEGLGLLTVQLQNPSGYGRIVRDAAGLVQSIVEEKDATPFQRQITEVNTGIIVLPPKVLPEWLAQLSNDNAQGEYYLTDVVARAVSEGMSIATVLSEGEWEVQGVNNKVQLADLERQFQGRLARVLMESGVRLADPTRLDIRGHLECARDVAIDVGCIFEGQVVLEEGVEVGPYCVIRNAVIRKGARLAAFTHMDGAEVGPAAIVGPYARLRPGAVLAEGAHVGNFVEIKNSHIGPQSKANHLAYVGDADVGARVNIGAGTITCNYDGVNKFRTIIEDDVFIGSDTQLVAPVRVGQGATLGAGTTLTRDAPAGALTVSRARQTTITTWKKPVKVPKA